MVGESARFADESTIEKKIRWGSTKPDGQPRRCLDVSRAMELMGWQAKVGFEEGLKRTIEWFRAHRHDRDARM